MKLGDTNFKGHPLLLHVNVMNGSQGGGDYFFAFSILVPPTFFPPTGDIC